MAGLSLEIPEATSEWIKNGKGGERQYSLLMPFLTSDISPADGSGIYIYTMTINIVTVD
jgi:hypothetical protein